MDKLLQVLTFLLLPIGAIIVGSTLAIFRTQGPTLRSMVQHFAAGIVFAVVALELLPELNSRVELIWAVIGFILGTGLMLGVKGYFDRRNAANPVAAAQPSSLVVMTGINVFVDGLVIGIGFVVGAEQGLLVTIALTIELLFLVMSVASALGKAGATRQRVIISAAVIALLLTFGAVLGFTVLGQLPADGLAVMIAFGSAALLYLVTEELLVEAHEDANTALTTGVFFAGFIVYFAIEVLLKSSS